MRILVLGAGATGGYFGARLTASGADVTFLVRGKRKSHLDTHGLVIVSPFGDLTIGVKTATRETLAGAHDIVILSCKAYDLASAIEAIRPALGPKSVVLPLLNGMKHLDDLDAAFGPQRVLGGSCHLSVVLGEDGVIRHLNELHLLTFGPRLAEQFGVCREFLSVASTAKFDAKLREDIVQAMWDKWVLLASLAGLTCLFRASVGEIAKTGKGRDLMLGLIEECRAVARASGFAPGEAHVQTIRGLLTDPNSKVVASMLRDMLKSAPIEADLIISDLLRRGLDRGLDLPLLEIADVNVRAYEQRRRGAS